MNIPEYDLQAQELAQIIDVAIEALESHPPEGFTTWHVEHFVKTYSDYKSQATNPAPKFKNLKTLEQLKSEALTYFQEGSGKEVYTFWKIITEKNIPLTREVNILDKILKRGKLKNQIEYDWLIDTYNSHTLSQDDSVKINKMIENFESGK